MSKNHKYYIFYLLIAILAYWQISFLQNMLKWDMIDAHMPWRMFISESIINGHFPLWNPYQDFGYPIHADMRSIWTPEIWVISLFGGYSVYTFSYLFIFYTSLAGIGMKLLSNFFLKDEKASFFVGLIYMLSGYLTAHAQELYTINSFAFIPIVLYQYLRFSNQFSLNRPIDLSQKYRLFSKPEFKSALYFIFFIYIILTSAYQAHSFTLLYLLIFLFIYTVIDLYRKTEYKRIKEFIIYHVIFGLIILLLLLPLIVSAVQVFPFVQRLNSGVDISTISILSFSPQSLLSLLLPFAVIRDMEFFNTDLSMTNLYFGIIPFLFLLLSLSKINRNPRFLILLIFGLFFLIASFGDYTPLRKILFDYVPFMNMFRGSAYFRLFTLVVFVISAGFVFKDFVHYINKLKYLVLLLISVFVAVSIYAYTRIEWETFSFLRQDISWEQIMSKSSLFYENILLQSLFQIFILGVLLLLIVFKRINKNYIIIIVLIEMIVAVQLNIHSTAISRFNPTEINQYIDSKPQAFPIPEDIRISDCTDKASSFGPLWRNTNIYSKRISADAFNSFYLDKTDVFRDSLSQVRDSVSQNKLLYFSSDIVPLSKINEYSFSRNTLFIQDSIAHLLQFENQTNNKVRIVDFTPVSIKAVADIKTNGLLTLMQTNYTGWAVYVDGEKKDIVESNTMFISVQVDKGKHEVLFEYSNPLLIYTFILSASILFLLLLLILFVLYRSSQLKHKKIVLLLILSMLILFSSYKQYNYHLRKNLFINEFKKVKAKNPLSLYISVQNLGEVDWTKDVSLQNIMMLINKDKPKGIIVSWKNMQASQLIIDYLKIHYESVDIIFDKGASRIVKFTGLKKGVSMRLCSFDTRPKGWLYNQESVFTDSLNLSFLKSNTNEYICSYSILVDKKDSLTQVLALVDLNSQTKVNPLLVFSLDKDGKSFYWKSTDYKSFRIGEEHDAFAASVDLSDIEYDNNSELKIYLWNNDKEDFNIDNFRIFFGKN